MSEAHHHHHPQPIETNDRAFTIGIALNISFVVAEVVAGIWNNSMSLLTDAGHNLSDVTSLVLSLVAFRLARRKPKGRFTYGYKKTTVLAALANAVILLVAIGILGFESVMRLLHPRPVEGGVIAWVAAAGIAVNSISAFLFYRTRKSDLNAKSAYLHLLSDALVSVGVVAGGLAIRWTGAFWIDPAIGLVVMLVILSGTWSLLSESFQMASDAVPHDISLEEVEAVIRKTPHVEEVFHLHVWALSTTENALTANIIVDSSLSFEQKLTVISDLRHELKHHNVHHATLELRMDSKKR